MCFIIPEERKGEKKTERWGRIVCLGRIGQLILTQ
jgi:hypothetical protein